MKNLLKRLAATTIRRVAGNPDTREADESIAAGQRLEDRGDFEAALACYRRAVAAAPGSPQAHLNVGNALQHLQRFDLALDAYRRAVACDPDYASAHFNLGLVLRRQGDQSDAEAELAAALRLEPSMKEAAVVLADICEADARFDEAERHFEHALASDANCAPALLNYGMFCARRNRFDDAIRHFDHAVIAEPGFRDVLSNFLFSLNFRSDLDPSTIANEHRRVGRIMTHSAKPGFTSWANAASPGKVLRMGYVSGDFLDHPVALFLRPVLDQHDRQGFETFCYSNYPEANPVSQAMRETTGHWREVWQLSDDQMADLIRQDEIDILVDLSGHTGRHRLNVFARHPAPVQATWLGYLNTTGLPAMDYRICDGHTDPEGTSDDLSIERLVRLPHSQWCYLPWHRADIPDAPHAADPDAIVFGSFNQARKITDRCLHAWSKILSHVPDASLLVLDFPEPEMQRALLDRARRAGIDGARLTIRGRETIEQYLKTIGNVDIALDSFPYNGATTTLDALWMGVPLVALRGDRGISRGSYSILKTLRMDELIATTPDDYVNLNVRLANDGEWRHQLRATLRSRLLDSPLMDAKGFTRALEERYREMWSAWCLHSSEPSGGYPPK